MMQECNHASTYGVMKLYLILLNNRTTPLYLIIIIRTMREDAVNFTPTSNTSSYHSMKRKFISLICFFRTVASVYCRNTRCNHREFRNWRVFGGEIVESLTISAYISF